MANQNIPIEFSSLIYGSLVNSLLDMTEDVNDVNTKLDEIGYRVGLRLAHEFARDKSLNFIDSPKRLISDIVIKNWPAIAGKGALVKIVETDEDPQEQKDEVKYVLRFENSIFRQNVTIPDLYSGVKYSAMLPGVIRGIFEIYHYEATATLEENPNNAEVTIISKTKPIPDAVPKDDD